MSYSEERMYSHSTPLAVRRRSSGSMWTKLLHNLLRPTPCPRTQHATASAQSPASLKRASKATLSLCLASRGGSCLAVPSASEEAPRSCKSDARSPPILSLLLACWRDACEICFLSSSSRSVIAASSASSLATDIGVSVASANNLRQKQLEPKQKPWKKNKLVARNTNANR